MTLDEFVDETKDRLSKFEKHWRSLVKKDLAPFKMDEDEWNEELDAFDPEDED